VIRALESVSNALVVAQSQQQQKRINDRALVTAGKARLLAARSFSAGMTDFLVLLNGEVALLRQQQERARINARLLKSHAGLMVALGGGYVPEQTDAKPRERALRDHRETTQP